MDVKNAPRDKDLKMPIVIIILMMFSTLKLPNAYDFIFREINTYIVNIPLHLQIGLNFVLDSCYVNKY